MTNSGEKKLGFYYYGLFSFLSFFFFFPPNLESTRNRAVFFFFSFSVSPTPGLFYRRRQRNTKQLHFFFFNCVSVWGTGLCESQLAETVEQCDCATFEDTQAKKKQCKQQNVCCAVLWFDESIKRKGHIFFKWGLKIYKRREQKQRTKKKLQNTWTANSTHWYRAG